MNGSDDRSGSEGNLKSFYAYKNTFDEASVWLEVPKQGTRWEPRNLQWGYITLTKETVTFVNNFDPYAEPLSPELEGITPSPHPIILDRAQDLVWGRPDQLQRSAEGIAAHGLEALSAAATGNHYTHLQQGIPPRHDVAQPSITYPASDFHHACRPSSPERDNMPPPMSPPISMTSSNNNLDFILNPSSTISPTIDRNLQPHFEHREAFFSSRTPVSKQLLPEVQLESGIEMEHEIAFLLRHFSESPGHW